MEAKITLKNVIDNSKYPELVAAAQDKLRIIEEQEAAKRVVPVAEELGIDLNPELDVDKLFAEPEKAIDEPLPTIIKEDNPNEEE